MASYTLVKGKNPERFNPDKPALHGLTALLARYWDELVTREAPSADEWECIDAIRDIPLAHMTVLAEDDKFDKERIRFVPFTEESLLRFRAPEPTKYLRALLSDIPNYVIINDTGFNYLVFRRKKHLEKERRQKQEAFFERCYY